MTAGKRTTILVTHRIFPETVAALSEIGNVLAPNPRERFSQTQIQKSAATADAMLVFMPDAVSESCLKTSPRLRMIAGALKGYDNLDVDACTRRGIWVSNVPDLLTNPTAELAIGLMIGLARHIQAGDAWVRRRGSSVWRPSLYGIGVSGSTVGFIGMGMIGMAIAERLQGFNASLHYFDQRRLNEDTEQRLRLTHYELDDLLSRCDLLVVTVPLTVDTYHLLNDDALRKCKPGALLINPARGSVVDETAVARALKAGRLGGYAADVFECEDLSLPERPRRIPMQLLKHPATLFTPHLGSAVIDIRRTIELRAVANIADWASGQPPRDAVNRPQEIES
jgi:phosphonate dehydrogenase